LKEALEQKEIGSRFLTENFGTEIFGQLFNYFSLKKIYPAKKGKALGVEELKNGGQGASGGGSED